MAVLFSLAKFGQGHMDSFFLVDAGNPDWLSFSIQSGCQQEELHYNGKCLELALDNNPTESAQDLLEMATIIICLNEETVMALLQAKSYGTPKHIFSCLQLFKFFPRNTEEYTLGMCREFVKDIKNDIWRSEIFKNLLDAERKFFIS